MMQPVILLLVLLIMAGTVHNARILAVLPFPSHSHSMFHFSVLHQLSNRGHQLEVYSVFPPQRRIDNMTHYSLTYSAHDSISSRDYEFYKKAFKEIGTKYLWGMGINATADTFKDKNIKKLLASDKKFDLVYIEPTLGQESFMIFGHRFKAPVINFQGFGSWYISNWITGSPLSLSYIPETLVSPHTDQMTFYERLYNSIHGFVTLLLYHYQHLPIHEEMLRKYYNETDVPPITEMLQDIAITFTNSYSTLEYPRPYPPNVIPIAGAHLKAHKTPLPQEMVKFMDESTEGVLFFSLGTIVPTHLFPKVYIQSFVNAFKNIKVKVLWKTDLTKEDLPQLSNNVLLVKWVSQASILAHPNCVGFMTHGGLFSQIEALNAAVPVVAVPFMCDQQHNARFYKHLGVGVSLELDDISEATVYEALITILNNPKYKENAQKVSRLIADQIKPPEETIVWWIEYALRHRDLRHLQPASARMHWYQLALLDVIAAVLVTVVLFIIVIYILFKQLFMWAIRKTTVLKKEKMK